MEALFALMMLTLAGANALMAGWSAMQGNTYAVIFSVGFAGFFLVVGVSFLATGAP